MCSTIYGKGGLGAPRAASHYYICIYTCPTIHVRILLYMCTTIHGKDRLAAPRAAAAN
jgi:hypothetical protein